MVPLWSPSSLSPRQAAAVRRALHSIGDGHIGLWVTVQRFDTATGAELPEPIIHVGPDRIPTGVPNQMGRWWEPMIEAGWLVLRDLGDGRHTYDLTKAGRAWMVENSTEVE